MNVSSPCARRRARSTFSLFVIAIALASVAGCDARSTTMPNTPKGPSVKFPIEIDRAVYSTNYVAGSRKADVDAAIRAVLDRAPQQYRAVLKSQLENPAVVVGGSNDAETTKYLSLIASIRQADARAKGEANRAADLEKRRNRVRVQVGLVSSLPEPNARAVVLRRTNDGGLPLVLLPESANGNDLDHALRAAAITARRYAKVAKKPTRVVIRQSKVTQPRKEERPGSRAILNELRSRELREIPGVGRGRLIDINVRDEELADTR
jgi:hypothetical protein